MLGGIWGRRRRGRQRMKWLHGITDSEWTPRVDDGQGGLVRYDSWGRKESDTTEQLNWTKHYKIGKYFPTLLNLISNQNHLIRYENEIKILRCSRSATLPSSSWGTYFAKWGNKPRKRYKELQHKTGEGIPKGIPKRHCGSGGTSPDWSMNLKKNFQVGKPVKYPLCSDILKGEF